MELIFIDEAWQDYLYWKKHDKKILKKITSLIKEIQMNPTEGMGSPEALKHNLSGYWSRRIGLEHRLVYRVFEN